MIGTAEAITLDFELIMVNDGSRDDLRRRNYPPRYAHHPKLLSKQRFSLSAIKTCSALFFCIAVMPCVVVSASSHYQLIVLKGYIQGHLIAFYSQLGLSSLLFLSFATLCNRQRRHASRFVSVVLCSAILACMATATFTYNNVNRQLMSANRQKWDAASATAAILKTERQDLKARQFYAPAFWTFSGVSVIPGDGPDPGQNYWTEYFKYILGMPVEIIQSATGRTAGTVTLNYIPTPQGTGIAVITEHENDRTHVSLIAKQPVSGTTDPAGSKQNTRRINDKDWQCSTYCVSSWDETDSQLGRDISFIPDDRGPHRLIQQFLLSRNGAFGYPYATINPAPSGD